VNDGCTSIIVFFLGDPHVLESGKRREDRSSDPNRELSFSRGIDLDSSVGRSEFLDFLGKSFNDSLEHGGSTGEDNVLIKILSDIDITFLDGVEGGFMFSGEFRSDERGLEHDFRGTEAFRSNSHLGSIRKFILMFTMSCGFSLGEFITIVIGNIAELFLDISDDFSFSRGGHFITSFREDLDEVISDISTSKVHSENGMRKSISFIDGHGVSDTITRVEDDTSGSTGGIKREHGLDTNIKSNNVEGLEHDGSHLFSVVLGVQRSLSQKNGMLFRGNTELVVEGVMPDLLHIVPVGDHTVFNGVFQLEDTSLGLSLITDEAVFGIHTDHDSGVLGSSNDGREDSSGSIISSETALAHSRSIVNHQRLEICVNHVFNLF
jgi:hypothetical protein